MSLHSVRPKILGFISEDASAWMVALLVLIVGAVLTGLLAWSTLNLFHQQLRQRFQLLASESYSRITERFEVGNIDLPLYNIVIQNTSNSKTIQNPKKLIGHKIVQFLAQQRKDNNGWDSLRGLDLKLLENFEKFAMQPYERDKTLFLYERVEAFMGYKDYNLALRTALSAVRLDPLNLRNIRTVLYVIRKKIFSRKENAS